MGVEPTTFGLEVQRASPLRHAGISPLAIIYVFLVYSIAHPGISLTCIFHISNTCDITSICCLERYERNVTARIVVLRD